MGILELKATDFFPGLLQNLREALSILSGVLIICTILKLEFLSGKNVLKTQLVENQTMLYLLV